MTLIFVWYQQINNLDLKENQKTFTVDLKVSYYWTDKRIVGNIEQSKKAITHVPDTMDIDIWNPSPKINNMKTITPALDPSIFTELKLLVDKNKYSNHTALWITMEYRATVFCPLDFQTFPFDTQKCQFNDVNRAGDRLCFLFDSNEGVGVMHDTQKYVVNGFEVKIEFRNFTNGNGFNIELKRLLKPHLLQYYLPCFAIVNMAFFSFVVPANAIPGRVALIVTQFLTLTNIFIHHMVIESIKNKVQSHH